MEVVCTVYMRCQVATIRYKRNRRLSCTWPGVEIIITDMVHIALPVNNTCMYRSLYRPCRMSRQMLNFTEVGQRSKTYACTK